MRFVMLIVGGIVDIKEALKITGWRLCEFKSDGDDECNCCQKPIRKGANIYYERTCYEVDEGEYYCESCTIGTPARWEKENNAYSDYVSSLNETQT